MITHAVQLKNKEMKQKNLNGPLTITETESVFGHSSHEYNKGAKWFLR